MTDASSLPLYPHRHLLGIRDLSPADIELLLDRADRAVAISRQSEKKTSTLRGRTQINLFYEASTRTQASFELAGKRLGADVMNMSVASSSVKKGETLIDTAMTLNAMRPDILIIRHQSAGAAALLAQKVGCSVVNAGDGAHEHPTQALLDALTIRRAKGPLSKLIVAICGDILHSRVARSNIMLLNALGAQVRVVAPSTLLPTGIEKMGVIVTRSMAEGLKGADVVMMLRLQRERMEGAFVPSVREYFRYFGLDAEKLKAAKDGALVMHPGPMNRGVEIASEIADDARSVIQEQVEMGVAVRMAVMEALASIRGPHTGQGCVRHMTASRSQPPRPPPDPARRRAGHRPVVRLDEPGYVLIVDGTIRAGKRGLGSAGVPEGTNVIDCAGKAIIAPGLIDARVFIGEPGGEHRETIASASVARPPAASPPSSACPTPSP